MTYLKDINNYYNKPFILKDYKDLIPNDYDTDDYFNQKPVEGVIFLKHKYKSSDSDKSIVFEILCYRIPHLDSGSMCLLGYPVHETIKKKQDKIVTKLEKEFFEKYLKDNIAGLHKDEFVRVVDRAQNELAEALDTNECLREMYLTFGAK